MEARRGTSIEDRTCCVAILRNEEEAHATTKAQLEQVKKARANENDAYAAAEARLTKAMDAEKKAYDKTKAHW